MSGEFSWSVSKDVVFRLDDLIRQQHQGLLKEVATHYGIESTELIQKYVPVDHYDPHKCLARLWGDGYGVQCQNKPKYGEFCRHHYPMTLTEKGIPLGRMDQPCPRQLPKRK